MRQSSTSAGVSNDPGLDQAARRSDIVIPQVGEEAARRGRQRTQSSRSAKQGLSATRRGREPAVCQRSGWAAAPGFRGTVHVPQRPAHRGWQTGCGQSGANGRPRGFTHARAHGGRGSMRPDQAPGVLGVANAVVEQVPVQSVDAPIIGMATGAALPALKRERRVVEQHLSASSRRDRSGEAPGRWCAYMRMRRIEVEHSPASRRSNLPRRACEPTSDQGARPVDRVSAHALPNADKERQVIGHVGRGDCEAADGTRPA